MDLLKSRSQEGQHIGYVDPRYCGSANSEYHDRQNTAAPQPQHPLRLTELVGRECYNVTMRQVMTDSTSSLKSLEMVCRSKLRNLLEEMQVIRAENRLLPMSFDANFYQAK